LVGAFTLLSPSAARAEEPGISATGKGITGGALLGAELVMSVEAVAGVKPAWAYLAGGALGAVGGGIGGYYVEQASDPRPSFYLLAAGMALIIPTTVGILQSTAYSPPAEYIEDRPGKAATPMTEPPAPGITPGTPLQQGPPLPGQPQTENPSSPAPSSKLTPRQHPRVALSLLDLDAEGLRLGVPAVEVRPMYSSAELRKFGVEQRTEVRFPVFQATF
jgi:hypothetical protein